MELARSCMYLSTVFNARSSQAHQRWDASVLITRAPALGEKGSLAVKLYLQVLEEVIVNQTPLAHIECKYLQQDTKTAKMPAGVQKLDLKSTEGIQSIV